MCPHRIGPLGRLLENQRDDLLAFVEELDQDIVSLAGYCRVAPARIRAVLTMQALRATSWLEQLGYRPFRRSA